MTYPTKPTNDPNVLYFVEEDYGKFGEAFRETDRACTDDFIVKGILSGELSRRILRIIAVNTETWTVKDATKDIGALVFYVADSQNLTDDEVSRTATNIMALAGFELPEKEIQDHEMD